jgi:hypothetical protein
MQHILFSFWNMCFKTISIFFLRILKIAVSFSALGGPKSQRCRLLFPYTGCVPFYRT